MPRRLLHIVLHILIQTVIYLNNMALIQLNTQFDGVYNVILFCSLVSPCTMVGQWEINVVLWDLWGQTNVAKIPMHANHRKQDFTFLLVQG